MGIMKYELRIRVIVLSMILASLFIIQPVYAADCDIPGNCPAGLQQIEDIFKNFIQVIVYFGFIVLVIMLVWAGIKYLTSGGEPKTVAQAHQTVTWALLGILFLAIAWLILLLIQAFTGVEVTSFNIKALCGGADLPFCKPK